MFDKECLQRGVFVFVFLLVPHSLQGAVRQEAWEHCVRQCKECRCVVDFEKGRSLDCSCKHDKSGEGGVYSPDQRSLRDGRHGRLVHHFNETFKEDSSKSVAVIVDGDSLRSVLVLEAWAMADQAHLKQSLIPHAGKVASLANYRLPNRGKPMVYFDRDLKAAFHRSTKVTPGKGDYPDASPLLPTCKMRDLQRSLRDIKASCLT